MRVRSTSYAVVCAACLVLAGGCVPTVYNKRPEVRGTVRDTAGAPIRGATVRVTDVSAKPVKGAGSATTDARGRFKVPPARQFGLLWLTASRRSWTWDVAAEAPGHTPASVELSHRGKQPRQTFDNLQFRLPAQ